MENIFLKARPNKVDIYLYGLLTVMIVVFMIGYLQSNNLQNFGTIYFYLSIFVFILMTGALATKFKVASWVVFGKENKHKDFAIDVGLGLLLGLILNLGVIGLSIGIPLLNVSSVSAGNSNLVSYIIIAFFGVLIEELFWIGTFLPTFINFNFGRILNDIASIPIVFSILVIFLITYYIGAIGIIIGIILLVISLLLFELDKPKYNRRFHNFKFNSFWFNLSLPLFAIVALHVYAYGNPIQNIGVFISAGIFFLIEGIVDYYRQSIIPSIIMHTVNNAIVGASILGIGLIFGIPASVLMISFMILFLLMIFEIRYINTSLSSTGKFIRGIK